MHGGIIPARAGFTRPSRRRRAWSADHPRSRGVYRPGFREVSVQEGSSPLARGLRHLRQGAGEAHRIIPARAGFTRQREVDGLELRDHPRSRGVYASRSTSSSSTPGSSPLARGLPALPQGGGSSAGIIPARAGFTRRTHSPTAPSPDHPRSRGVYVSGVCQYIRPARIIPARAGFTRDFRPLPYPHPGSSPLARGLRLS